MFHIKAHVFTLLFASTALISNPAAAAGNKDKQDQPVKVRKPVLVEKEIKVTRNFSEKLTELAQIENKNLNNKAINPSVFDSLKSLGIKPHEGFKFAYLAANSSIKFTTTAEQGEQIIQILNSIRKMDH